MQRAHSTLLSAIALSGTLMLSPVSGQAAPAPASYATAILQNVREDKVYLLENVRGKLTKPSEKMVVEALLTEDGPKAASLYRKQLAEYPDPQLDAVSRSRLAAYDRAAGATAKPPMNAPKTPRPAVAQPAATPSATADTMVRRSAPPLPAPLPARRPDSSASVAKPPVQKPAPQPVAARPAAPSPAPAAATIGNFTLQFGSFDSAANAEQLAAQLPQGSPAGVMKVGEVYKVRLKRSFETKEEAAAFARNLPIESFVVTLRP